MIAFALMILGWLVSFFMTISSWLVTVVVLGWLAQNVPTTAGLSIGVAGLGVGIGCIVLAQHIYELQREEAKRAEERSRAFIQTQNEQLKVFIKPLLKTSYLESQRARGRRTTDEEAELFAAGTTETIISHLGGFAILHAPQLVTTKQAESTWGMSGIGPGSAAPGIAFAGEDEKKIPNEGKPPKGKPIFAGEDEEKS